MRLTSLVAVLVCGSLAWPAHAPAAEAARVLRACTIDVSPELRTPYAGRFRGSFPRGFEPSFGSGLHFLGRNGDSLRFLAITDRGPNIDGPLLGGDGTAEVTKVFPVPRFAPEFGEVRVSPSGARLVSATPLLREDGGAVSGVPPDPKSLAASVDVPLDESLAHLPYDRHSLDPEGIDVDRGGDLWLGDEYGPSIVRVDRATGRIRRRYAPGAGLPAILRHRQINRGFEGLAVTPAGKVYAILESVLDIDGRTLRAARFIRLIELDPATGHTRSFAYPHDVDLYASSGDAKIGDLVAIDDTRFLLVEQGKTQAGRLRNVLYRIDIGGATDVTKLRMKDGRELEHASEAELEALGVRPISKRPILDLRSLGWTAKKAEGLAIIDDRTIAVSSDDDFGIRGMMIGDRDSEPDRYRLAGGALYRGDSRKPSSARFALEPRPYRGCLLWVIRLARPLTPASSRASRSAPTRP
jgi:hypothetical protein